MKTATAQTCCLAQFINDRTKSVTHNLEQEQARAQEVYETCVQVLLDDGFPLEMFRTFPSMGDVCEMDAESLAQWWDRFGDWQEGLSLEMALKLSAVTVIA